VKINNENFEPSNLISEESTGNLMALNVDSSRRRVIEDLRMIQAQFPFLEITPFPTAIVSKVLDGSTAEDLALPDGTILVRFTSTNHFTASIRGRAGMSEADGEGNSSSMLNPTYGWFYVRGLNSISVFSTVADTQVFCHCIQQM
jgi:hypothetical protein